MKNQTLSQLLKYSAIIAIIVSYASTALGQIDPWKISASNINSNQYYGVTAANGMLGIVSSPEPLKVKNVVLAGAYDQYGRGRVSNFLNSFNFLNFRLSIDEVAIDSKNSSDFTQELNMKEACLNSCLTFKNDAEISYSYYALRHLPFCALMNVSIKANKDITIEAANIMEAPDALRNVENYYNEIDRPHAQISLLTSSAKSPTEKLQLCSSTTFIFDETNNHSLKVLHEMWDNNMHLMKFKKTLKAGETFSFAIVGSSITSAHHPDPLNEAERLTIYAKLEGKKRLIDFHRKAWDELWKSDIAIEGDDQAQQDTHNMLYHLYSFAREGSPFSISPMGLSGLGYNGHIFWDTDLWMFPCYLMLQPEIAKSLIEYRFNRLEAAKQNAFLYGFKGAKFPWESADSGFEETPVWALTGPFEHHITACVALAAWNYYAVTQDKQWLKEKGWPILSETANFWASRVERNEPKAFDIKNVVAADEWAENVDNNAFTNAAAIANLQNAILAAKVLDIKPNPDWELVAKNIPILSFPDGVTKEHSSYSGEGIKQADVNLLAYPLKYIVSHNQIKRDLDYYSTRVPHEGTPAMTQAIFALLYARLGDVGGKK
jgi:trehalose/maltose hydrolase-like predicted phosphorylase